MRTILWLLVIQLVGVVHSSESEAVIHPNGNLVFEEGHRTTIHCEARYNSDLALILNFYFNNGLGYVILRSSSPLDWIILEGPDSCQAGLGETCIRLTAELRPQLEQNGYRVKCCFQGMTSCSDDITIVYLDLTTSDSSTMPLVPTTTTPEPSATTVEQPGVPRPDLLRNTMLDIPPSTFVPRCSGTERNLAECQNETSSSTTTCQPQDFAAGVTCFNNTPTSSAIPDPTTIDIAPTSTESTATPTQPPQSSQPQTETVDLPTSSSFTSRPPGTDFTPLSLLVSTDTESNSDSLSVVIYLVTVIAVLIFIANIVLVILISSIKALHRSRVKDAEPASPTAEKTVLNNQLDHAVPEPVYAEPQPKPAESPGPIRASNPSFQYHIYQEVGPGTWNRTAQGTAQAVQTENVPQLKDGPVLEVQQLEASYNSLGYSSLENGRQYATLEPFTVSRSSSHSQEDFSNSTKPDCPCQRDRCSYHNHLVSEFESQQKTYADYGQLATDEEMLDSSSHAQEKLTLARRVRAPVEESECTQHLHTNTSAHQLMEEDVMMYTTNEEGADTYPVSERHAETAMSANLLQSAELSISAPTPLDFICTKPDCPCQRDQCIHYNHLVSEFESQHMTYANCGQLNNNTDMPDSPNHAQQKLALEKSVRIQKSDSTRNQSSQQSHLQIIDKLNPSVPFMDGIDVIECDSLGGHYYNPTCDFVLEIPVGAVPEGTTVQIEVGVSLYGPFQFPDNARPISPIVWLCVRQPQPEGFKFLKPIKVTLPHYLDLMDGGEESLELGFLKAGHHLNQNEMYHFMDIGDGKATFQPEYGVIHTDHFCYLCLKARSGLQLASRSLFCLHRIVPKPVTTTAWDIVFCVTFSLQLCLESVKKQYPGYKIVSNRFKFKTQRDGSEPKLKIHFSPRPPGGWQLVLESAGSEITPSEVEFLNKEVEEMEWMHMTKEYPPKLTIEVSGEMAVAKSAVEVTFTGIDDQYLGKVNTTISLLLPQLQGHMNSDELSLAIPRVLSCPGIVMSNTMNQLRGVHPIPFNGAATTQPLALMYNPDGSPLSLHNQAEDESQLGLRHASVSSGFASISSLTASSDIGGFHFLPRDIISTGCYSHPALQEEPELRELMNEVAAKVPDKWKDVGIQLGLNIGTLNGISVSNPANPKHCLCEVFSEWRKQGSSPYTWSTVVQALEAEAVGEYHLAQDLTSRLIAKYGNDAV